MKYLGLQEGVDLSTKRDLLFVHIPRTGGTSIKSCLSSHQYIPDHNPLQQNPKEKLTFCFIRSPWERIASAWHSIKMKEETNLPFYAYVDRLYHFPDFNPLLRTQIVDLFQTWPDFIGDFRHLQTDFDYACSLAGLHPMRLPRKRYSGSYDYRTLYGDDNAELVCRLYADDIETFDFTFE